MTIPMLFDQLGLMVHNFKKFIEKDERLYKRIDNPDLFSHSVIRLCKLVFGQEVVKSDVLKYLEKAPEKLNPKGPLPYVAYATFLLLANPVGIQEIHNCIPQINQAYPEYDRGHIEEFIKVTSEKLDYK